MPLGLRREPSGNQPCALLGDAPVLDLFWNAYAIPRCPTTGIPLEVSHVQFRLCCHPLEQGEPSAAILPQAVYRPRLCAAKAWWRHLAVVHGRGAWSLTKLCYLRAKARGSRPEKTNSEKMEALQDLEASEKLEKPQLISRRWRRP